MELSKKGVSMRYSAAAIQMDCILGDYEANMAKAERMVEEAVSKGAKLIVLPELFSTGFRLDERYYEFAEHIPNGNTVRKLEQWAKAWNVYIVGCIVEHGAISGIVHDTAMLVGPSGYIGKHRKMNPWWQEKLYFKPGGDFSVFDTPLGRLGIAICYEGGFPEISRQLAIKGADLIIVPSAFGKARLYAWEIFTRARALENGCFLIAANRCGEEKGVAFAGHSRIVNPQGAVKAELAAGDGVILADVDLEEVARQRRNIPYLLDLRTDLFSYSNN
jgi:predicted amidohydrolase